MRFVLGLGRIQALAGGDRARKAALVRTPSSNLLGTLYRTSTDRIPVPNNSIAFW